MEVFENGTPFHRRIQEVKVQARNGRVYDLRGTALPIWIGIFTGSSQQDHRFAEILLAPEGMDRYRRPSHEPNSWPCLRDVTNIMIGFAMSPFVIVVVVKVSSLL